MTMSDFLIKKKYSILLIFMFAIITFIPSLVFVLFEQPSYASGMLISSCIIILLSTLINKNIVFYRCHNCFKILIYTFFF